MVMVILVGVEHSQQHGSIEHVASSKLQSSGSGLAKAIIVYAPSLGLLDANRSPRPTWFASGDLRHGTRSVQAVDCVRALGWRAND